MKTVLVVGLKGGTGKSVVSAILASQLAQKRGNTILIDADVDSPNLSEILKVDDVEISPNKIGVAHLDGMDFFSMGLIAKDRAISMSGDSYVQILLDLIQFGDWKVNKKDAITIIDCPAGASDTFRGVLRAFSDTIVGAIVVSIPQAYYDLDRILKILEHFSVPVLGVIENMAFFKCKCGEIYEFGNDNFYKIIKRHNTELLGRIPFSVEIKDVIETGIPYIPDDIEPILDTIYEKVEQAKPAGDSILKKLTKKVSEKIKRNMARVIINAVLRTNKEINLADLQAQGFGGNIIELLITDKGTVITQAYFKLSDGKLKVVKNPKKVDITIVAEVSTLIQIAKGETDLETAFYFGEIEVFGVGGTVRALSFFEKVWRVMKDEIVKTMSSAVEGEE